MNDHTRVRMQKVGGSRGSISTQDAGTSRFVWSMALATEFGGDGGAYYVTVRDMATTVSRR